MKTLLTDKKYSPSERDVDDCVQYTLYYALVLRIEYPRLQALRSMFIILKRQI